MRGPQGNQRGANVDVMTAEVPAINPTADLRWFPDGFNDQNIGSFLDSIHSPARRSAHHAARCLRLPEK
jgi:hypothetical protein